MTFLRNLFSACLISIAYMAYGQTAQIPALDSLVKSLTAVADESGSPITITYTVESPRLTIYATMDEEDDSIEYIAGYLSPQNALRMLAPFMAPVIKQLPQVQEVAGVVTDQDGKKIELMFTCADILQAAGIK